MFWECLLHHDNPDVSSNQHQAVESLKLIYIGCEKNWPKWRWVAPYLQQLTFSSVIYSLLNSETMLLIISRADNYLHGYFQVSLEATTDSAPLWNSSLQWCSSKSEKKARLDLIFSLSSGSDGPAVVVSVDSAIIFC